MRTLIAIPCMDMVHTVFMKSLLGLKKVGDVAFTLSASSLIYDARNGLAKQAVTEKFDRILWLDSDMDFSPDILERLSADLDEGREFVTGLYFTRKAPVKPNIFQSCGYYHDEEKKEVTPVAVNYWDYPKDSVFEIEACGFGGCLMTTDLVKRVGEEFGLPFSPILGFGEDLSFCSRVKQLGVPMYCDSRVKMGHVGMGTITEQTYEEMGHGNTSYAGRNEAGPTGVHGCV